VSSESAPYDQERVWRLAFVLVGLGFAWSSASWFAAGRRSRARARYLERTADERAQSRYWRAVMAKDNLIGALFLTVAIAIAGVGAEQDVRMADVLLLASSIPLVLSLAWVQRFRWAAGVTEVTAERAQQLREQGSQERDIAAQLAARLGATDCRPGAGFIVESLYCPIEGAVGGDFIGSVHLADDSLAFLVGDITGHGLAAALDAMRLKDLLLADLARHGSPAAALAAGNAHLHEHGDVLATVFIGVIDDDRELRYASAGHLSGLVIDEVAHRSLPSTGTILGAEPSLEPGEHTIQLRRDDTVIVYTDGLIEAYGPAGGLEAPEIARLVRGGEFSRLRDHVHAQVHLPLRDDIAALLVRVGPDATVTS
jgi:serine phosphatase RsbU (regulator of sigma subunit)